MSLNINKKLLKILSILHNLCDEEVNIYLIGGFLRDKLLGKESKDLDFIIHPFSYKFIEIFSRSIKGKVFPLDEERKYFRVSSKLDNEEYIFDFTPPQREDLWEEIIRRDFTINTIILDLLNLRILDPLGGIRDLKEGILRVCSPYSISDDPLRILRAFRFASNFGLKISKETEEYILKEVKNLKRVKEERIHDEIYKILKGPFTKDIFLKMKDMRIIDEIFPELKELEDVPWSEPHHTNPLLHSIEALGKLEYLYFYFGELFPRHIDLIKSYLEEKVYSTFTKKELLKLAILLHDIGKSKTYFYDEKGKVHYYGHENIGTLILENISERLRLSKIEENLLKRIIKNHLYPAFIFKDKRANRFKVINRLSTDTIGVMLVFLGDQLSIDSSEEIFNFASEIFELYIKSKKITPLLSGDEIMQYFSLKPSPLIGKLKEALIHAQQEGIVKNKEEAFKFLKEYLYGNLRKSNC